MSEITRNQILKKVAIAALAYTFIEALVAGIGRRALLTDFYNNNPSFFDTLEPSLSVFLYGMSMHLFTGILVSVLYARMWVSARRDNPSSPRNYAIIMGLLHWVLVVYGYLGRHHVGNEWLFVGLESVLIAVTFTLYGLVLAKLFPKRHAT